MLDLCVIIMCLDEMMPLEDHKEELVVVDVFESCPCVCIYIYTHHHCRNVDGSQGQWRTLVEWEVSAWRG